MVIFIPSLLLADFLFQMSTVTEPGVVPEFQLKENGRFDKPDRFTNLTIRKIPNAVLKRCEWGHNDYSLRVENLPKLRQNRGSCRFLVRRWNREGETANPIYEEKGIFI